MTEPAKPTAQAGRPLATMELSEGGGLELDLLESIRRQFWLIAMCVAAGICAAAYYSVSAKVWYESNATILVSQRDPQAATGGYGEGGPERAVDENILANHIVIIRSKRIVGDALARQNADGVALGELSSIKNQLDRNETPVDYVIDHLSITAGGSGVAAEARSLNLALEHTNRYDVKTILAAIVSEYQQFLDGQLEEMSSQAMKLVNEAREQVEAELQNAEEEYVNARRNAPLLFSGEGSGNVYVDKFRKLEDELLDVEITESSVRTRLEKVLESLDRISDSEGSDLEKLALIDSESLERLGMFAQLQMNSMGAAEVALTQADRSASARTEAENLLKLRAEAQRLESNFGPNYPELQTIRSEIAMVEGFLAEKKSSLPDLLDEADVSPEALLQAYVGFLNYDLLTAAEKKKELKVLAEQAERDAKTLIEFELKDEQLKSAIERQEVLYAGIVDQLRELDTASAFSGFIHKVLEEPEVGGQSWPSLPICLVLGAMLGGLIGLILGFLNDRVDDRFRSAKDVEKELNVPILGSVPKVSGDARGQQMAALTLSPGGEAFRTMRTVLLPEIRSGQVRAMGITSSIPGDGKSLMNANLAAAFGQAGVRTLVIDGDMRRPTGHKLFSVDAGPGLSDILTGRSSLDEVVQLTDLDNVSVVAAGRAVGNPAELLQSQAFVDLLEEGKSKFDLVMIDAGPVLALSDPMIVGQRVDGIVFVTRVSRDGKSQAAESVRRLRSSNVRLLGCIINTCGAGKDFESGKAYKNNYYYDYETRNDAGDMATATAGEGKRNGRLKKRRELAAETSNETA